MASKKIIPNQNSILDLKVFKYLLVMADLLINSFISSIFPDQFLSNQGNQERLTIIWVIKTKKVIFSSYGQKAKVGNLLLD
jgi:hypothetical protein